MRAIVLAFAGLLPLAAADWKVSVDKKPSLITGSRNARAQIQARRQKTTLLIGCRDSKPILRIAENFGFDNAIADALLKSQLERSINRGQGHETQGFRLTARDGVYYSQIKLRPSASSEFLDTETVAGYNRGTYFLVLDDRIGDLLPKMKADTRLFAQLPYKTGDKVVEFSLEGLGSALTRLGEAGCHP